MAKVAAIRVAIFDCLGWRNEIKRMIALIADPVRAGLGI